MDRVDMSALSINDDSTFPEDAERIQTSPASSGEISTMDVDTISVKSEVKSAIEPRRSSRKKAPKRLVSMENKEKQKKPDPSNEKDIEKIYLNKNIKLTHLSLETIPEEPQNGCVMTKKKFKRRLIFKPNTEIVNVNKMKSKKRCARAKKLCESLRKIKKKLPMNLFLEKLSCLDNDECSQEKGPSIYIQ
ncbi:unnamed protein product [Acanthoscelides obtectus]|uniref:Tantalus-like domain-containing protein n=1 Tax=Acanthoscelides obtectus TaxID=200917 RepID=A0A9P0JRR1_ACAOB|nr:unnamed protein product [Acanthoscelides obtectus]CAK1668987.1 hypothetical protein AOBTE_LOCUS26725 [Acanthoscelides obtectus]